MFIKLTVLAKDKESFKKLTVNMNLVFIMERQDDITVLFTDTPTGCNPGVKETPEEIMQLIKEAKHGNDL